jgi:hypothetical protein
MTTKADKAKALEVSIAVATSSAVEHGHTLGLFVRKGRNYVAAEAACAKCGRKIVIDTQGVIKVPLACV